MKRLWILVLMLFVFSGSTAWAQQPQSTVKPNLTIVKPLVLYDDFNGPWIDPAKWNGTAGDFSELREALRELTPAFQGEGNDRRLHVLIHDYADTRSDQGGFGGRFGLLFPRPDLITETSFTVAVNRAKVVGCETNSSDIGVVVTDFRGTFFNTENSPTSQLGDVVANIGVARLSTDTTKAFGVGFFYQRCDDDSCGAAHMLDQRLLGYLYPGQPAKLRIKWDQPNHQFIFQMNKEPEVVSQYLVADSSFPWNFYKSFGMTYGTPNCTTAPRPETIMDAYFDNAYVNAHQ